MNDFDNFGFPGPVPPGVSVDANVQRALDFQSTHTPSETVNWFYEMVRNNKDGRLPPDLSMDYKQIDRQYADFGNFNYAAVGKALGFPDSVLKDGAGYAQGRADGLSFGEAIVRSLLDPANRGDNPEDQYQIWKGINAADNAGVSKSDVGISDYLFNQIEFAFDLAKKNLWKEIVNLNPELNDLWNRARSWFRRDPLALDLNGNGINQRGQQPKGSETNSILSH